METPRHHASTSAGGSGGHRAVAALFALLLAATAVAWPAAASADVGNWAGFRTTAGANTTAQRGASVSLTADVTADHATTAIIDLEVFDPTGQRVFQKYWSDVTFSPRQRRVLTDVWQVPADAPSGDYVVMIGVFRSDWGVLWHWNDNASVVSIATPPATTTPTTTTTTTTPPTTTSPTTTAPTPTTAHPTTTVAAPRPTTTQPAPTTAAPTTTTAPPPSGVQFFEDFAGNQGMARLRHGVWHRERDAFGQRRGLNTTPWQADHDPRLSDCGDPRTTHHPVSVADGDEKSFYVCRDHMMTTMGDVSGYSVVWFSPNQTFSSVREVCWEVNVSQLANEDRQWWEVAIQPASDPEVTAVEWLAGTANLPAYTQRAVILGYGPDDPLYPRIDGGAASGRAPWPHIPWFATGRDTPLSDPAVRVPQCIRQISPGVLEYETVNDSGRRWSFRGTGNFPTGPVEVVFKSHAYTPNKACGGTCRSYTWHWDDITVR